MMKNSTFLLLSLFVLLLAPLWSHAGSQCREVLHENAPDDQMALAAKSVYVPGDAKSDQILFLTKEAYLKRVREQSIPVNAILVLEELPLIEDLPLVAGLLVGKELSLQSTHVQLLAEKVGIPLVMVDDIFENHELRGFAQQFSNFELQCAIARCQLLGRLAPFALPPRPPSVLPLTYDRTMQALYHRDMSLNQTPREVSGDKYFNLMTFKQEFPDLVPDISALSSGFYETFMEEYVFEGKLLRELHKEMLENIKTAESHGQEDLVKSYLAEFRKAIEGAHSPNMNWRLFYNAQTMLVDHYVSTSKSFSLRSNNDVEDLLATGLYKSTIIPTINTDSIEAALKRIWASMFEYRAYSIRRYWGQREENLSMPILVHPYLEDVSAHAVGSFTYKGSEGMSFHLNMVLGAEERATNPTAQAQSIELVISKNSKNKFELKLLTARNGAQLRPQTQKELVRFVKQVENYVKGEFLDRSYAPKSIDIELVVEPGKYFWNSDRVQILQYKPSLNRDIMLSVLGGLVTRDETDQKVQRGKKIKTTDDIFRLSFIKRLSNVDSKYIQKILSAAPTSRRTSLRYALLLEDQQPYFVIWDSGEMHQSIMNKIMETKAQWYKSGYIKMRSTQAGANLLFTATSMEQGVDRPLHVDTSRSLFQKALEQALQSNAELRESLHGIQPVIEFDTHEGGGYLKLPF